MGFCNQDELRKCTGSERVSQQLSDSSAGWLQNVTVAVKLPAAEYCLEVRMSAKWELIPVSLAPSPQVTT